MIRKISAIVLGALLAFGVRAAAQAFSHAMYPSQPGLDLHNSQQARLYFETVPAGGLLLVLVGAAVSTLAGAWFAAFIAKERPLFYGGIVGLLVLVGTIINFYDIPHPTWFMIVSFLCIPVMAFIGSWLGAHSTKPATL